MNNKQKVAANKNKLNRLNQLIANIKKESQKKEIDEESQKKKIKRLNIKLKSKEKQKKEIIKRLKKLESNVKEQNDSVSNTTFIKDTRKQVKKVAHHKKQKFNSNSEIFLRTVIKPKIKEAKEQYDYYSNLWDGKRYEYPEYQDPAYRQLHSKELISSLQLLGKTPYEKNMIAKQVNDMFHEIKCTMKYGLTEKLKRDLKTYSDNTPILNLALSVQNYTKEEKNWNLYCTTLLDPEGPFGPTIENDVRSENGRLSRLIQQDRGIPRNSWPIKKKEYAVNFWKIALRGTLSSLINNRAKFKEIVTQRIPDNEIEKWYFSGLFGVSILDVATSNIYKQAVWQMYIDIIEKVFCKTSFIGKGMFDILPSRDDLMGGICYDEYNEYLQKKENYTVDVSTINWDSKWFDITNLRNTTNLPPISNSNYWDIVENKPNIKLNRNNIYSFSQARSQVLNNRPEIYLDFLIRDYMNSLSDIGIDDWQKTLGICAFSGVCYPTGGTLYIFEQNKDNKTVKPNVKPNVDEEGRFTINHANLILFTPVITNKGVFIKENNKIQLKCSYFDPNVEIIRHVKPLIKRMVDNLRDKISNDNTMNCVIKEGIDWLVPNDINLELNNQALIDKDKSQVKNLNDNDMDELDGGKKVRKVRKHQGIIQTGGNAGRLQKGYRYSGKKLKNGLPQIIKCKSKKC